MRKELKTKAKTALKGNLGKAVAVTLLPVALVLLVYLIQGLVSFITSYMLVTDVLVQPFTFNDLFTLPVWSYVISGSGCVVIFLLLTPIDLGTKRWYFKFFEKNIPVQTETVPDRLLNLHFKDIGENGVFAASETVEEGDDRSDEEDTIVFTPIEKQPQIPEETSQYAEPPAVGEVFELFAKAKYYFGAIWLKTLIFIRSLLWMLLFSLPALALMAVHFYLTGAFAEGLSLNFIYDEKALYLIPAFSLLVLSLFICSVFLLRYFAAPYIWSGAKGNAEHSISASKAIKLSVNTMKGRKLKFIGNVISFFGWGVLSLSIFPLLYTVPYFNMFLAAFVHESLELAAVAEENE
ncbi:MAG: DUF975 family protein [Oscillospiraceae bacterium]|nr:DUF975 family protein [Oscillospiraceae bacterium]